ncbi:MAG: GTPase Era [Spirochaetales bacterium]
MDEAVSKGGRVGVVAIVGRPSAGKSSLINSLCEYDIAIVSDVPQTTRNRIRGILTRGSDQLIFIDTPGFHASERVFNQHMTGLIQESIRDAEIVLYVIDASRHLGEEEEAIAKMVGAGSVPVVVAINKRDIASRKQLVECEAFAHAMLGKAAVIPISARTDEGVEALIERLISYAPEGERLYPDEFYTDQPPEFRVAEIIRGKAMHGLKQEVPHSIYVDVADLEVREDELFVRAFVVVERESQKGILVGKGGSNIKRIRQSAQKEIASLFPYRVYLDLRVKVNPKWRNNEAVLKKLVT